MTIHLLPRLIINLRPVTDEKTDTGVGEILQETETTTEARTNNSEEGLLRKDSQLPSHPINLKGGTERGHVPQEGDEEEEEEEEGNETSK